MKVTFKVNHQNTNECFGKKGTPNNWLKSIEKYLGDEAVVELAVLATKNINLATLSIKDDGVEVYASAENKVMANAIDEVIQKSSSQLEKNKERENNFSTDTIRYSDKYSAFEMLNINEDLNNDLELVETEKKLATIRKTQQYNTTMNKYISYLFRENEIDRAIQQFNILFNIYYNVDPEIMTVADYNRLVESLIQIGEEIAALQRQQCQFENNTKDQKYINNVIDDEYKLVKLKINK